jgi:tRNA threonylcarbamoyladenosine biosynthesis protein TsaB
MIILTLRTDNPQAEVGLYENEKQLSYKTWGAHRMLAETLHQTIDEVLQSAGKKLDSIEGIVYYKGPGSFTGLRIGLSVANALAYGLQVPIVGIQNPENWLEKGLDAIKVGQNDSSVIPEYGAPVHITTARK